MIRSGVCSLASFSAWSPLTAISTIASPLRSSVCLTRPAMSFSSSTTRTRVLSALREGWALRKVDGIELACIVFLDGPVIGPVFTVAMAGFRPVTGALIPCYQTPYAGLCLRGRLGAHLFCDPSFWLQRRVLGSSVEAHE